ncbi:GHKL domain-containing protein [Lactiplantibacillus plantarum]|uniref:sensor histidine kinase n=1 Tax=Lactiplantibacillus plantarum TaxID=1590 RepID=UPI0009778A6F|nr:GHKL domain-containing protein [Lactiplantibacillus plantarum]
MLSIEFTDAFYQGSVCFFTILVWYYYLIGALNKRALMRVIVMSLLLGAGSVFVSDISYLIVVAAVMVGQIIRYHRLDYARSSIMIFLVNIQVIMSNILVYTSRWIILCAYGTTSEQRIYHYGQHMVVLCYVVVMGIMNALIISLMKKYSSFINAMIDKIKYVELQKHIFGMLLILFVAIEGITIISMVKQITAIIQIPLIMSFFIMMVWQMFFFISSYTKKQAANYQAKQNAQLNEYLKSVEQQYLELRKFKHDYKNLMLSLQDSLINENSVEQAEYFKELIAQKAVDTSLDNGKIAKIQYIGNETLRGLIVQKFFDAQTKGIELSLELDQSEFIIKHNLVDVVRIVGNLLDNAIDAAKSTPDKQVTCAFNSLHETKEISVRNSTNKKLDVNKMFELGASTKGSQRGFGLSNVQQLVDKQKNFFLDVDSKNDRVIITLTILEEE